MPVRRADAELGADAARRVRLTRRPRAGDRAGSDERDRWPGGVLHPVPRASIDHVTDIFTWLLLLVPASALSSYLAGEHSVVTFAAATVAIVPLAEWIRRATEHLARRAGPAIGGLLNVSFGNTAELILALFVLAAGKA